MERRWGHLLQEIDNASLERVVWQLFTTQELREAREQEVLALEQEALEREALFDDGGSFILLIIFSQFLF